MFITPSFFQHSRAIRPIITAVFFISLLVIFFMPFADNDFGWHYRCGSQILQGRGVCHGGEFLYFLSDYHWANPNFLYDILSTIVFNLFGFWGLSFLGSLLLTLIITLIYRSNSANIFIKIVLIYVAIFSSWSVLSLGLRSQLLSLLFGALTFYLLETKTTVSFKKIIWLIPLFGVWANTHGSFFLGPLIFAIYLAGQWLGFLRKKVLLKTAGITSAVFGLAILATLLNPFNYHIYEEIYRHWQMPLNTLIAEWVPPSLWPAIIITVLTGFFVIYTVIKDKIDFFTTTVLVSATFFALKARRNLPLFYFYYLYLVLKNINFAIDKKYGRYLAYFLTGAIVLGLIFWAPQKIKNTISFSTDLASYCSKGYVQYPCQATEFFKKFAATSQKSLNVFNTYEWGGFLVWQLPEHKIFIDGRMPAWSGEAGQSPYTTWLEIIQARSGWDKKLASYGTNCLFIGNGTFLDLLLQEQAEEYGYQEIYRDKLAVIWLKS
ncbi:hypothetical protein A3C68_01345 [Candidatus Kuenenbacteria bacterium RIFCSPHIGHO2_02_FULL_42_29]|nr:MAG: hypothetical protein A3C68_01345 [Candidatus Kuenenbacteria bacterium RIFCSPHIGHO2_02_FULL_42_29]